MKRRIRESLFEMKETIKPNYNIVVIARPKLADLSLGEVKSNLEHVFKLANIIE